MVCWTQPINGHNGIFGIGPFKTEPLENKVYVGGNAKVHQEVTYFSLTVSVGARPSSSFCEFTGIHK